MSAPESWKDAYHGLLHAMARMGYPEEFGKVVAKNLGSEKAMRRMTSYLCGANPQTVEEIVDEMFAIRSDRDRWIQKKQAEQANARYNEILYYGLEEEDGDA